MSGGKPPSKPVLIAAVLPFIIAVAGMLGFGHFGISEGVIICIVALIVYYVIFGIVFAVISLKQDKKHFSEMEGLTLGKYLSLTSDYENAQTEEEQKEAAEKLELALRREVEAAASKKLKAGTIILMVLTVIFVVGAFVSYAFDKTEITFACIGAFVGTVLIFVVVISFSSRVRTKPPRSANKIGEGTCLACADCIAVSYLSGFSRNGLRLTPEYSTKANYKLIIELDGRRLFAYSHERYFYGNKVKVAYSDKSNKCYII